MPDFEVARGRVAAACPAAWRVPVSTCALVVVGCVTAGCTTSAPAPAEKTAESVVQRAVDAHGGLDAWERLREVTWRETVTRFAGEHAGEVTVRTIHFKKAGGRTMMRIEQDGGRIEHLDEDLEVSNDLLPGPAVLGYDGTRAWYMVDGKSDNSPRAERSARYVTVAFMYWFGLPFKLLDEGVRLELLEPDPEGNDRVEVTFASGTGDNPTDRFIYHFDRQSGRIEDIRYWRLGRTHRPRLGQWRDYVKVADVWKESLRVFYNAATMEKNTERRFEYLAVNSGLDDELFTPAGSALATEAASANARPRSAFVQTEARRNLERR